MGKIAKWVEDSQGEFCQLKKPKEGDDEDGETFIEFLESWSLYYPRERKEEAEDALCRIQGVIDRHTLPLRELLSEATAELTSVCAE